MFWAAAEKSSCLGCQILRGLVQRSEGTLENMGASREAVRFVHLDKSLWHNVKALGAGGLPAWELPLLGRACSAFASSPAPPFL